MQNLNRGLSNKAFNLFLCINDLPVLMVPHTNVVCLQVYLPSSSNTNYYFFLLQLLFPMTPDPGFCSILIPLKRLPSAAAGWWRAEPQRELEEEEFTLFQGVSPGACFLVNMTSH